MELLRWSDEVPPRASALREELPLAGGAARLIPSRHGAVLVCGPAVRALVGGRRALAVELVGKMEFQVAGERFRVRAESGAVSQFEAGVSAVACARCKLQLRSGDAVAGCACGALFHQGERAGGAGALPCFTYGGVCPACGQPTADGPQEDGDD
jgi:hypothetical protein